MCVCVCVCVSVCVGPAIKYCQDQTFGLFYPLDRLKLFNASLVFQHVHNIENCCNVIYSQFIKGVHLSDSLEVNSLQVVRKDSSLLLQVF